MEDNKSQVEYDQLERGSEKLEKSFEDKASFFESWFFLYLSPLFEKGYQGNLNHNDLGPTSLQDRCDLLLINFEKYWEQEKKLPKKKRSLWRVLWKTVGISRLIMAIFYYACYTAETFGPVMVLNALVKHFQGTSELSQPLLWTYVCLMFILPMTGSLFAARSNAILAHLGLQFRNVLIDKIYRKSLSLSPASRQMSSTGQIVNMFSNDTNQLQRFLFFMNNLFLALPTIGVCLFLIYLQVGVATFVGLGMIVLIIPLNSLMFDVLSRIRKKKVLVTDIRVKLMNEILNGIRIIKFYAWEHAFKEKIDKVRYRELVLLRQIAYIVAVAFTLILQAVPVFLPVLIFFTYVQLGNQLDAARVFTTISLFNLLQFPFVFLPLGFTQYSQSLVSSNRMLEFFDAPELEHYVSDDIQEDDVVIRVNNASLGWIQESSLTDENKDSVLNTRSSIEYFEKQDKKNSQSQEQSEVELSVQTTGVDETSEQPEKLLINRSINTLNGVTFEIKKGELVAVIGGVGSGKSSLLNALLGEMHRVSGTVQLKGSIAYCEQRTWIVNQTVEENILFGKPYDEEKFDLAMYAANLEDDVQILAGGIKTQIGERGINLSGGQKARVALARAVYRDADIYLLDDPLSAVDAHVGQFLFKECICETLKGKTRILVTHQTHLLPCFDKIIILDNGSIKAFGSYDEINQLGINLEAYIPHKKTQEAPSDEENPDQSDSSDKKSSKSDPDDKLDAEDIKPTLSEALADESNRKFLREKSKQSAMLRKKDSRAAMITTKEERNQGEINWSIYYYFMKSGGFFLFFLMILFIIIGQVFVLLGSYWLSYWGQVSLRRKEEGDPLSTSRNLYFLQVFAVISSISLVCYVLRSLALANHRMGVSIKTHRDLLKSTLGATVSFFDVTPVGRVLNRFSSDLLTVDEMLFQTINQASNSMASVLGAFGAIAGATKGTFLVLMVPLFFIYNYVQKYFRATNTTVARLESVSRSPIYADFSQALSGMSSIRAYKEESRFIKELEDCVNHNSIANVTPQLSSQWLAIRLDFLGSLISFFIALIAASTSNFIPAGYVALGLTYSFQLTTYIKFLVRMLAQLEAQMNSVERIKYYIDNIEEEKGENEVNEDDIPKDWPSNGVIDAEKISMRYRDGPLILKNVSFHVDSCNKVGVVGRTGSGKSSLMIALFRIQELVSGNIKIDGIDISTIPLRILRTKLGIIPQDPVMFSASVRFNLDPFNEHTDLEIWDVLSRMNMKEHIQSLPRKLDEDVSEGGDNFSAGQRQATASIDNNTDAIVQKMIREQFSDCTVLTIAHRLNTIIDSDRIIVLNDGLLAEMDSPEVLLKNPNGLFQKLWEKHIKSHSK